MEKLLSRPWAVYMDTEIGSKADPDLPQESESVIKNNFNNIPFDRFNIFGTSDNKTFFKKFSFKIDRYLMLDNKEENELSYSNIKNLFKLLIGTFKIEARFLYQELEVIINNGEEALYNNVNILKPGLPYSKTALSYFLKAKSNN